MENKMVTGVVFSVLLAACGNGKLKDQGGAVTDSAVHSTRHMGGQDSLAGRKVAAVINDVKLQALYDQYQQLTKALVAGDDRASVIASNALEAGATKAGQPVIARLAAQMTLAGGLEQRRILFSGLSNEVIARVKRAGMKSGKLFVDFCPMALDNKGAYWLSAQEEVKNPYFGSEMLDCGNVEDSVSTGNGNLPM